MNRIDALRSFGLLAAGSTFTDVSRELGVGQPTVSKWLAELEEEAGATLLERSTRHRRLTDAGARFEPHARAAVLAYEQALDAARDEGAPLEGPLRLSVPVVLGRRVVLPRVRAFMRCHPGVQVDLRLEDRYVSLSSGEIDVALRVGVPLDSALKSRRLAEGARWWVASPDYLERRAAPGHPSELADHECILRSGIDRHQIWRFEEAGKAKRVSVKGAHFANHSDVVRAFAREGRGVALLAEWAVSRAVKKGKLVRILEDFEAPEAPVYLLWRDEEHLPRARRAMIDHLVEHWPEASQGN